MNSISVDAKLLTCLEIAYLQEMCRHVRVRALFAGFIIVFVRAAHKSIAEVS